MKVIKGYPPQNKRVYIKDVPERLRPLFNPKEAIYRTTIPMEVEWTYRDSTYRITIESGFHYDAASIPWPARIVGFSRHSRYPYLDWMSLPHDGGYRGAARFPDIASEYGQRLAFDRLMRDMALWAVEQTRANLAADPEISQRAINRTICRLRRKSRIAYRTVRMCGSFYWKPRPDIHDLSMMTIEQVI